MTSNCTTVRTGVTGVQLTEECFEYSNNRHDTQETGLSHDEPQDIL